MAGQRIPVLRVDCEDLLIQFNGGVAIAAFLVQAGQVVQRGHITGPPVERAGVAAPGIVGAAAIRHTARQDSNTPLRHRRSRD